MFLRPTRRKAASAWTSTARVVMLAISLAGFVLVMNLAAKVVMAPNSAAKLEKMLAGVEWADVAEDDRGAVVVTPSSESSITDSTDRTAVAAASSEPASATPNTDAFNNEPKKEQPSTTTTTTDSIKSTTSTKDDAKRRPRSTREPGPTNWLKWYNSPECVKHRQRPVGRATDGEVGLGRRSLCYDVNKTVEWKREIGGSVDISFSHKAIYVPVMKAGTQMFQEVFKHRFHGVRVHDREVEPLLKRHNAKLSDFFVFTFVRNPFSMFRSAYGEVSLYAAHGKILHEGFTLVDQVEQNEPKRALQALDDIRHGMFAGLVPAHMFTQVWKTQRCVHQQRGKSPVVPLELDFVGHLENLDEDWKYIEQRLGVPHLPLPVIHSSDTVKERIWAKEMVKFVPVSRTDSPFSKLTKRVCEYYHADFVCFGYDDELTGMCHA